MESLVPPPPPADESSRMRVSYGGGAGDPCHAPGGTAGGAAAGP